MSSVPVGILHSLSGTMAISEAPLIEAELMAIAEINQTGGILGKLIDPIIEDGASEPAFFEAKAKKLIQQDRVSTVFGCWTSASRKAVLPIFEELNALLWYPLQYEGLECSKNIFYTGSCPNQQVEPAVTWLLQNKGKRFFLLGSDYVFPRTLNKLITSQLKSQGGIVIGEEYVSLGANEFIEIITKIEQLRPDVVFSTLNGDSNLTFYRQYQDSGITAIDIPILAVSVAEAEIQRIGEAAVGHYACWSYFQSLDTPNNQRFVRNFQANYGADRVTSDPIEAAYTQVHLWKQAVELAASFEVDRVRVAAYGQSFEAPSGLVRIEPNHHLGKACRIGRVLPSGQFEIVGGSNNLIKPLPWLGVEQVNFRASDIVIDMLAEVSQGIHKICQLEQKSRELEAAKAQLQREVTQRQRVEAVLCDSEAQLQALFAAMTDVVLVIDAQGRYLKIAPTKSALLYKPADQLIGKTLHEVIEQTRADTFVGYIREALTTQQTVNLEYSLTIGDQEVWFAASISPISEDAVIWVARDITERKHAEAALQESEARFRAAAEGSLDAFFIFQSLRDETGRIIDFTFANLNSKAEKMISMSKQEVIGKRLCEILPINRTGGFFEQYVRVVETGIPLEEEFPISTPEVTASWLQHQVIPLSDGIAITSRDITERKLSEEALKESEARLRLALESAQMGIWDWNIATNEMMYSQQLGPMFGLPRGTYHSTYEAFLNAVHPEDSAYVQEAVARAIEEGADYAVEFRVLWPDGALNWIGNKGHVYCDETGKPIRMVGVAMNISDRKQAEEALRQTEERYHSIFKNSDEGLFQTAPDGRYLSANPALARIYGYSSPEELIASLTNINEQLYVDSNRRAEYLTRMQADERVSDFESQIYRKDGGIIWISENSHVVRDAQGELLYYEGSIVDITQRKVWEEALRYQQACAEELLLNILPSPIAQRLKLAESTIADSFASVTVLFADLVDFTKISAQIPPTQLVDLLNRIFSQFDQLSEKHGLEKIKTIGDAYMVVGGLPTSRPDHAEAIAEMALDMQQAMVRFKRHDGEPFRLRIGINSGPVIAGVIGMKKFAYDLWGDTVNVASRMESQGVAGKIQVTAATYEPLKDKYCFEERGITPIKGKGEMMTYWLTGRKVSRL